MSSIPSDGSEPVRIAALDLAAASETVPIHSDALRTVYLRIHQANAVLAALQKRFEIEPVLGTLLRSLTGGGKPPAPPKGAEEVLSFTAGLCLSRLADITEWYAFTILERVLTVDAGLALKIKDKKVSLRELSEHLGSVEDIQAFLRDQVRVHLENKGMDEVLEFYRRQVGVPLFSEKTIGAARLMMTMRHIQVHNNGVWDQKGVAQAAELGHSAVVGDQLEVIAEMVGLMSWIVLANLEAADKNLIARFGLTATVTTEELQHLQDRYVALGEWYRTAQAQADVETVMSGIDPVDVQAL